MFPHHSITTRIKTFQPLLFDEHHLSSPIIPLQQGLRLFFGLCLLQPWCRSPIIPLQQGLRPYPCMKPPAIVSSPIIPLQQGLRLEGIVNNSPCSSFPHHSITTRIHFAISGDIVLRRSGYFTKFASVTQKTNDLCLSSSTPYARKTPYMMHGKPSSRKARQEALTG